MVATRDRGGVRYRGSSGSAHFTLASGQKLDICADDEKVIGEMKRRGFWDQAEPQVQIGQAFVLSDSRRESVSFFVWFGAPNDGGFIWYSFPGAAIHSADVQEFIDMLMTGLFAGAPLKAKIGGSHGSTTT